MNVINVALQMCAPREVVLQQMWREEEDGTFIVLLHSTKHRRAAMPPASWSWWQPIRAQVCLLACYLTCAFDCLLLCLPAYIWPDCVTVPAIPSL